MPVFVRASKRARAHYRKGKPLNLVPRRASTIKEFKLAASLMDQGMGAVYSKVLNRVMANSAKALATKMNIGIRRKRRRLVPSYF